VYRRVHWYTRNFFLDREWRYRLRAQMQRLVLIGMLLLCWLLPAASAIAKGESDNTDRIVLSGPVLVDRGETSGSVVVADGDVTIRGTVDGDIVVADGDVTIRGTVDGDIVAVAGRVTLGRAGRVTGDVAYGDKKPFLAPGSRVSGDVKKFELGDASIVGAIGFWIGFTISLLVLGLVLLALAPKAADAIARTAKAKTLIAALVGLLAFFLIPIVAIAACVTLIGLPLGIVLLFSIVPLYAIAYLSAALILGGLILKKARILAFVVGLVILQLLTLIPIAGGIIGFLATVFGLGVLLLTLGRARS
jgi:cytoskeletal protein CcmA (bactofilin family)